MRHSGCCRGRASLFALGLFLSLFPLQLLADFNPVERASVTSAESQVNAASNSGAISTDNAGRYVAFASTGNLGSVSCSGQSCIFLRDRTAGTTTVITLNTSSLAPNGGSFSPSISGDGLYTVFYSLASNLISSDINDVSDIFLYDRSGPTLSRVSRDILGSDPNSASFNPVISDDGAFIAFDSLAYDLVSGDSDENPESLSDVFVAPRSGGSNILVSVGDSSTQANGNSFSPAISADGEFIAFASDASNLELGSSTDTDDGVTDIFRYKKSDGSIIKITFDTGGGATDGNSFGPAISDDGRFIAFYSSATDLVSGSISDSQVYLWDELSGTTNKIILISRKDGAAGSVGNGASSLPSINSDGTFVTFVSSATNLVSGDTNGDDDIFARNTTALTTTRISVKDDGGQLNGGSSSAAINDNGQFVAFTSSATTLVVPDFHGQDDVYVMNTQCLLAPSGITEEDQDGDSTTDCSDDCAEDSGKIAEGVCGCGVADTDSDADGTEDCNDECPSDANKIAVGACGCGVADTDANGNGNADCNDPDPTTVPPIPISRVTVKYKNSALGRPSNIVRLRIHAPDNNFGSVTYKIIVRLRTDHGLKIVKMKQRTSQDQFVDVILRNLPAGIYRVSYKVSLSAPYTGQFSQESPKAWVRIKDKVL